MCVIVKNEKLKELELYCLRDASNNAFALWDLRVDRNNTEFYVDWRHGELMGYMLIYNGGAIPSVIIKGSEESTAEFLNMLTLDKVVIHLPREYVYLFTRKHEEYIIDVMVAEPQFYFYDSEVKLIKNPLVLRALFENPQYLVEKAITFGILQDNLAVSSASALVHLPEVWVLGAVITKKEYRNQGLATRVVGHFMSYAYGKTEKVVLWVRHDNRPAIRLYKKFRFEKIGEEAWLNVGVSITP